MEMVFNVSDASPALTQYLDEHTRDLYREIYGEEYEEYLEEALASVDRGGEMPDDVVQFMVDATQVATWRASLRRLDGRDPAGPVHHFRTWGLYASHNVTRRLR